MWYIERNIIIAYTAEEYIKTWFSFYFYPTLSSSKMEWSKAKDVLLAKEVL